MARDEDEDLYDDDFDFVDEDDDAEDESGDEPEGADESAVEERAGTEGERPADEEPAVDEYGRPEPAPNYVVHIYENKKFKRTIDRPFTPSDAEAFATEYNRTAKSYQRVAVSGKNDTKPKKSLE